LTIRIEIQEIDNGFLLDVFNFDSGTPNVDLLYCKTLKEALAELPKRLAKVEYEEEA